MADPDALAATGATKSEADALARDRADPLSGYRERFLLPPGPDGAPAIYLAGQSLGLQPRTARLAIDAELDAWARLGVDAWFDPNRPWFALDDSLRAPRARIVGAQPTEVAILNTLTVNIHLLLASFFRPAGRRRRILTDGPLFPLRSSRADQPSRPARARSRGGPARGGTGHRFDPDRPFVPAGGAAGWKASTPSVLALAPLAASLAIFEEVGMPALRARSVALTGYLAQLLEGLPIDVVTPHDPEARGAQPSLRAEEARRCWRGWPRAGSWPTSGRRTSSASLRCRSTTRITSAGGWPPSCGS